MDKARQETGTILYSEITKCKFYFGDMKVEIKIMLKFSLIIRQIKNDNKYTKRIFLNVRGETLDSISAI
jgi:hypothetical protein